MTIAEVAIEMMEAEGTDYLYAGMFGLCQDIYHEWAKRNGRKKRFHPINQIDSTIAGLRRSPLFERDGYIRCCNWAANKEILRPVFRIKGAKGISG